MLVAANVVSVDCVVPYLVHWKHIKEVSPQGHYGHLQPPITLLMYIWACDYCFKADLKKSEPAL